MRKAFLMEIEVNLIQIKLDERNTILLSLRKIPLIQSISSNYETTAGSF